MAAPELLHQLQAVLHYGMPLPPAPPPPADRASHWAMPAIITQVRGNLLAALVVRPAPPSSGLQAHCGCKRQLWLFSQPHTCPPKPAGSRRLLQRYLQGQPVLRECPPNLSEDNHTA